MTDSEKQPAAEVEEAAEASTVQPEEKNEKKFEIMCGLILAILAASLAITDLYAGKYGDDEMIAVNEKASAYQWYQAKAVRQSLVEGRRDLLVSLTQSGSIDEDHQGAINSLITDANQEIDRYKKEKAEILHGSAKVGKENWVQEVDGKKGQVVGALVWSTRAAGLGEAGDKFDVAILFLQMCLVMGAIALIVQSPRTQMVFFWLMIVTGVLGTILGYVAYRVAVAVV